MKHFSALLLLLALLTSAPALAQKNAPQAARYEYCELHTNGKDIYADFGYGPEKLGGGELSKLEAGKLQVSATYVSALNYMGSLGWELVEGYRESTNNRYFVMRRLRSSQGINVGKP